MRALSPKSEGMSCSVRGTGAEPTEEGRPGLMQRCGSEGKVLRSFPILPFEVVDLGRIVWQEQAGQAYFPASLDLRMEQGELQKVETSQLSRPRGSGLGRGHLNLAPAAMPFRPNAR